MKSSILLMWIQFDQAYRLAMLDLGVLIAKGLGPDAEDADCMMFMGGEL